jgi:hypothetical protein
LVKVFQIPLNALDTVFKLRSNTLNLVNVRFTVQKHTPLGVLGLGIAQRLTYFTVGEGDREREIEVTCVQRKGKPNARGVNDVWTDTKTDRFVHHTLKSATPYNFTQW